LRIFCFFEKGNLVVLLSGFQKKTQKTPKSELKKAFRLKKSIMKTKNNIVNWDDHLVNKYGKRGTEKREKFQEEFEAFRLGVLIQEARKSKNLTQQQLAEKAGTTKSYISRIENNASDIRLSTLMRIIREGLGGGLHLSLNI
jgi:HTH-type transcriptional regulator/antitoxin HipB